MTSPLDLDAITAKWLQICGSCDAGIGECTHPGGVRPAVASRAPLYQHACGQVQPYDGSEYDGDVMECDGCALPDPWLPLFVATKADDSGDYRPVMLELVREVEQYRSLLDGDRHTQIEVQTAGLTYPCGDMAAAWRQYGELRAKEWVTEAHIMVRTHYYGPWTEVPHV